MPLYSLIQIRTVLGLKYPNATIKELSYKLSEEYGISNKYYRENLQDAIKQSKAYEQRWLP